MSIQEVILLFADVVKEAMPFVVVFFFGCSSLTVLGMV